MGDHGGRAGGEDERRRFPASSGGGGRRRGGEVHQLGGSVEPRRAFARHRRPPRACIDVDGIRYEERARRRIGGRRKVPMGDHGGRARDEERVRCFRRRDRFCGAAGGSGRGEEGRQFGGSGESRCAFARRLGERNAGREWARHAPCYRDFTVGGFRVP